MKTDEVKTILMEGKPYSLWLWEFQKNLLAYDHSSNCFIIVFCEFFNLFLEVIFLLVKLLEILHKFTRQNSYISSTKTMCYANEFPLIQGMIFAH